jgi:hypothetical protein
MNWKQFCSLICERFPNPGAKASMELCQQLKQTSKVDHYIDQFGDWMKILKSDHHYLPQSFFLLRFLSGLKDKINHDTPFLKPATLRATYWFAKNQEQPYLYNNKNPTAANANQPRNAPHAEFNRNAGPRVMRPRNVPKKPKERGKCWYCPENWNYGHKCNDVKSLLHAIQ